MEEQIKRIQEKIQQLLRHQQLLQKENKELKGALEKMRAESSQQQDIIQDLKQKVEILKISSGKWEEGDKKQFEKRINSYIREIDRCITLLSE
ncbi:MAG: hypothetical protein SFU20_14725 [Chitinophagaceae bacterium]|nr:hypothetical protein [Chitinophagales bacterium]MDX1956781.1 hypothetical protein [Chitinophagaceae bacterium]